MKVIQPGFLLNRVPRAIPQPEATLAAGKVTHG